MPRLGHKKSRLGCRQCKARHVKCDELKPCSNCARHGVLCSLVTWDPSVQPTSTSASNSSSSVLKQIDEVLEDPPKHSLTSARSPSEHNEPVPNQHKIAREESNYAFSEASSPSSTSDHFPFLTKFIHRQDQTHADLWVRDLELMHHWTTEAYEGLSHRDDMHHCWRQMAPQHAVAHPYFMHEILAFAALHKAHTLPEQRSQYYDYGVHHQDLSIRGVREQLRNITAEEGPALFATSTLLTLSVFASTGYELNYPEIPASQNAIDGILNIFILMQGMGNVLAVSHEHVAQSFLAPILQDAPEAIPSQPMLDEVLTRLPPLTMFIQSKADMPEREKTICLAALAGMPPCLQLAQSPCTDNRELRFLFFWPLHIQPDFFNLVRQRHSGALVAIMYYTTMLFAAQPRYWFMEGWGTQLMKACFEELTPDWHPIVQWPMSFLAQNPMWSLFENFAKSRHGGSIPLSRQEPSVFPYSARKPAEIARRTHSTTSPPSTYNTPSDRGV